MIVPCFPPEPVPQHPHSEVYIGPEGASFELGRGFVITRGLPTEADYQGLCAFRRLREGPRIVKVLGISLQARAQRPF